MAVLWTTSSGFSPEVGVCSFARFSGEFLQAGSSVPDSALLEAAAAGGPETLPRERGRTLCFSALGMVQCCKVSTGDRKAQRPLA
jgi:archaemetzincin